jgi:hypothetical protein
MVPTFTSEPVDEIGAQLCPCSLATVTPQTFTVASRPATSTGPRVPRTPSSASGCALLPSPDPPGSSWWIHLEGLSAAGFSRTPLRLASRAWTIWQCWPISSLSGLLTALPGVSRIRLPSASPGPLRRTGSGVLSPPPGSKAPRGARCPTSTPATGHRRAAPV